MLENRLKQIMYYSENTDETQTKHKKKKRKNPKMMSTTGPTDSEFKLNTKYRFID